MAQEGSMPESEASSTPEGPQMTAGEQNDISMGSSMRIGMENQQGAPAVEKPKSLWEKIKGIGKRPQA